MFNKVKKIIELLQSPKALKMLVSMNSSGYLKEIGWINSFKNKMPLDKDSNPLPWVTYGFIDFISERLNNDMCIFEYGSGNSTLWYSSKVRSVISVEHDRNWYNSIQSQMPKNVSINYKKLEYDGDYCKFSNTINESLDIIIVDGRDRVNCIKNALNNINDDGIIVLDDSEREAYKEGIEFLTNNNFKRIDFWGISPGVFFKKNTTIFYRKINCLGI